MERPSQDQTQPDVAAKRDHRGVFMTARCTELVLGQGGQIRVVVHGHGDLECGRQCVADRTAGWNSEVAVLQDIAALVDGCRQADANRGQRAIRAAGARDQG